MANQHRDPAELLSVPPPLPLGALGAHGCRGRFAAGDGGCVPHHPSTGARPRLHATTLPRHCRKAGRPAITDALTAALALPGSGGRGADRVDCFCRWLLNPGLLQSADGKNHSHPATPPWASHCCGLCMRLLRALMGFSAAGAMETLAVVVPAQRFLAPATLSRP